MMTREDYATDLDDLDLAAIMERDSQWREIPGSLDQAASDRRALLQEVARLMVTLELRMRELRALRRGRERR